MTSFEKSTKKTVKLNVGGVHFKTSLLTLTKDPDSMLASMFSGRFEENLDEDGSFSIDRDGDLFRYILNYLRNGKLLCCEETLNRIKRQLFAEAQFFNLEGLIDRLSPVPKIFTESSIITSRDEEITLLSWITDLPGDTRWRLLYKATRDGWNPANFHEKCDGKCPTLVVIKSDDNVFGGYTDKPWFTPSEPSVWISCPSSFLFSLHSPKGFSPKKIYPNPCNDDDIVVGGMVCGSSKGPTFGSKTRSDIATLCSKGNPRFGATVFGSGFGASLNNEYLFVGSRYFLTADVEVFGLLK